MAESEVGRRSLPAWLTPSVLDTAYWVFFALYASVTCLWLLLAAWSVFSPQIFPHAYQMHEMDAGWTEHAQDLFLSLVTLAMGFFLIWRVPDQFVARWFAIGLIGTSAGFSLTAHHFLDAMAHTAMSPGVAPLPLAHMAFHLIAGGAYAVGLLLFPDGKLPKMSAALWAILAVLSGLLAYLILHGHEPAFFIVFCGAAVIVCGPLGQWLKSRHGDNAHDRAVSDAFFRAFAYAVWLACALAVFEQLIPWWRDYEHLEFHEKGHAGYVSGMMNFGFWPTLALTALPPLLAAVGIVVFFGIVEYPLLGTTKLQHRPRAAKSLISVVMVGYVLADAGLHRASERLGEGHTILALLILAGAVGVGLSLERSRDRIQDDCRRLVFGTPVDPSRMFGEFIDSLGAAVTPEEVTAALGLTLRQYVGASAIRLNVLLPDAHFAVYDWPQDQFSGGAALPLGRVGAELGALWVSTDSSRGPLGSAERELTAGVALQAAMLVRAMKWPLAHAGSRDQLGPANLARRRSPTARGPKPEPNVGRPSTDEERGGR